MASTLGAPLQISEQLAAALAGRYAIDRLIGEGGMATVYLARDVRHNRRVALKVLRPDLGAVLGVDRFVAEIEVTANLQHPNLLPLFDSGAAGELLYYVMPYIEGESLRARLDRERQLPVDEAVRLATAIGNALDFAHRQGVIHRDLKPENVLLQDGQPLVADFGIALAVSKAGGARVTQTGLSLGTPQYMSPEQATGDRVIDARTDIYSLGALMYEMLTGEAPHTGSTAQAVIARVLTERPRRVRVARPAVAEHVEAAVERALEKLPADRWASAREFAEALSGARPVTRTATSATAGAAGGPAAAARVTRPATREWMAWGVALVLAVALGAVRWRGSSGTTDTSPTSPREFNLMVPDSTTFSAPTARIVALSRDGRTVVFAATSKGEKRMLYVRRMNDRTVQPIPGSEGGFSPVLSYDGTEVLFTTDGSSRSTLYRLPLRGGTPRPFTTLAAGNGQASWGADGRVLYAARDSLWIQSADGGPPVLAAAPNLAKGQERYGFPHWLPDGQHAVVVIWPPRGILDSLRLGILSLKDQSVTDLGLRGTEPRYAASGHLLFADASGSLQAVPFDARSQRVTGPAVEVQQGLRVGGGGAAAYDVSHEGTLIWLEGTTIGGFESSTLVAVDRTGRQRSLEIPPGVFRYPRVSPDGRQVVFTAAADKFGNTVGAMTDIWRAELSPPALYRMTTTSSADRGMFSRDGRHIFFGGSSGVPVEQRISLQAGAVAERAFGWGRALFSGDVGPSGGYSVFGVMVGNRTDLWVAPTDSLDRARPFTEDPGVEQLPRVSPSGTHVAYVSDRTGTNEVYIRQLPSGGVESRVSVSSGYDPVWAPDGRELFFRTPDSMYVVPVRLGPKVEVGRPRALFLMPSALIAYFERSAFDVLPGGREFVFFARTNAAENNRLPLVVRMQWASGLTTKPE